MEFVYVVEVKKKRWVRGHHIAGIFTPDKLEDARGVMFDFVYRFYEQDKVSINESDNGTVIVFPETVGGTEYCARIKKASLNELDEFIEYITYDLVEDDDDLE